MQANGNCKHEGLRRLWQRTLGDGYSSIAVAGGKLFTMYRKHEHEHLLALDAVTGQPVWEHRYPAPFLPNTNLEPGPGPHATPLIAGNRVCCVGVTGILHCLDRDSGRVLWKHQLFAEFDGTILYRGYSSSPLAYDDSVIVTVSPTGLEVRSKAELFQGQAWTVPTLVGDRLYIRNRAEIMAFELP